MRIPSEDRLIREISELEASRDQAKAAVDHVLDLLRKADARRLTEGDRPWNRILDNLENALDLTRARLTTYQQLHKERTRDLERLRQTGKPAVAEPACVLDSLEEQVVLNTLREVLPEDVPLPKNHLLAAERILAMPLDVLGKMTLDEAERMNAQLFEEPLGDAAKASSDAGATVTKKSWLEERIAKAKKARESLSSTRRAEPTFAERRHQMALRNAIEKVIVGNFNLLDLAEIDLISKCAQDIDAKAEKSQNDQRLKLVFERSWQKLSDRASELRRRRAQMYARKPYSAS